jgi:aminomethyltransferase
VAALAVQGPTSCAVLLAMGLTGLEQLKPFGLTTFPFEGETLMVSRTGFTGDLGYELWIAPGRAELLWDRLFEAGNPHIIKPFGSDALDLARIEAGFLQAGVDFVPAESAVRNGRSRSPFELGLGWLVDLDKPVFNGRRALQREQAEGSRYRFAMLDVDGNKPAQHSFILKGGKKVGTVTSAAWCPTAKSNVAFAQIEMPHGAVGDELVAEIYYQRELQWTRVLAPCRVIDAPVFNPPRRRAVPPGSF